MNSIADSAVVRHVTSPAAEPLRVICGPTAAGKSAIAMSLAERFGATIISADSRQVYRDFDIGTAKPSVDERQRVPHEGIDVVAPVERYAAAHWAADAARWVEVSLSHSRTPVVVGGTGFYIRSLVAPLFEEPAIDEPRRAAVRAFLATLTPAERRRWCGALDPARAALGPAQISRAIEMALLTGVRISDMHDRQPPATTLAARYLVMDPGTSLAGWIEERVDRMLRDGWMAEVERLMERVPRDAPAWKATGYATVRRMVEGAVTVNEGRERIIIDTRQYAKRQRTWIRHQLPQELVTRIDPRTPDALERAIHWWTA